MLILPHTLSLITTHHCTAACENCCFNCSPKITKKIPLNILKRAILDTQNIPTIESVVFTGGECFTLKNELTELVQLATSLGHNTRCITNGYWANTQQAAETKLIELVKAGLKEINFSTGEFHQKWVPEKNIINGVIAAAKFGLNVVVNVELCNESSDSSVNIFKNKEIIELSNASKIKMQRNVWIENTLENRFSYNEKITTAQKPCNNILEVLTLNPDCDLIACCGLNLEQISDLKLGKYSEQTSLFDIVSKYPLDLLKIWIHLDGPDLILKKCSEIDSTIKTDFAHPCKSCLYLYKNKNIKKILNSLLVNEKERLIQKHKESLELRLVNMLVAEEA